jgi:hypothetical protein
MRTEMRQRIVVRKEQIDGLHPELFAMTRVPKCLSGSRGFEEI